MQTLASRSPFTTWWLMAREQLYASSASLWGPVATSCRGHAPVTSLFVDVVSGVYISCFSLLGLVMDVSYVDNGNKKLFLWREMSLKSNICVEK